MGRVIARQYLLYNNTQKYNFRDFNRNRPLRKPFGDLSQSGRDRQRPPDGRGRRSAITLVKFIFQNFQLARRMALTRSSGMPPTEPSGDRKAGMKSTIKRQSLSAQGGSRDQSMRAAHAAHFTNPVRPMVQPDSLAATAALFAHSSMGSLATSSNSKKARQSWDSHTSMNSQNSISSSRSFSIA